VAELARTAARRLEHLVAEVQQPPRDVRLGVRQHRQDVDLRVPEVLTLVAASGQALGGDPVTLDAGRRLADLKQVEAHGLLDVRGAVDLDVRVLPEGVEALALDLGDALEAVACGTVQRAGDPS
jgi:hypothetical protein